MKETQKNNKNNFKIRKLKHTLELLIVILERHQKIIDDKKGDLFSDNSSLVFMMETHLTTFLGDDMDVANITDFVENYFIQA